MHSSGIVIVILVIVKQLSENVKSLFLPGFGFLGSQIRRTGTILSADRHHRQIDDDILTDRFKKVQLVTLIDQEWLVLFVDRPLIGRLSFLRNLCSAADIVRLQELLAERCSYLMAKWVKAADTFQLQLGADFANRQQMMLQPDQPYVRIQVAGDEIIIKDKGIEMQVNRAGAADRFLKKRCNVDAGFVQERASW